MERHEVVIVGAGLAGAATAYHLVRLGLSDVVLLEQEPTPGVHSSGRNVGFLRQQMDDTALQPLADESAPKLREGQLGRFQQTGGLLLGRGDEDGARYFPLARGRGKWCPEDGRIEGVNVLHGYLAGQDVRYGVRFLRFERPSGERDGLRVFTTAGEFGARTLVNAAGPWAGALFDLPLEPLRRHVFVTDLMPNVDPSWPFLWDLDHGYYLSPESGGLLLSPCDELPSAPGDYREELEQLELVAERLAQHQPGFGDLRIAHRWVGQRTFARDRRFVIGHDPREPRLYWVAALGGHGLTTSYAVGRLAADGILAGPDAENDPTFAPARLLAR